MDILPVSIFPHRIPSLAKRKQNQVLRSCHKVFHIWRWTCCDDINFLSDLSTIWGEWEIIHVMSERIFNLAANCEKSNDYICRNSGNCQSRSSKEFEFDVWVRLTHWRRYSCPMKKLVELKREKYNVYPWNLSNCNAIRCGKRCIQHTLCPCQYLI